MPDDSMRIEVAGENALIVYLGDALSPVVADRVRWLDQQLRERLVDQLIDTVPSYASVLVIYRPDRIRMEALQEHIEEFGRATSEPMTKEEGRLVTLPVWYGPESGPDLAAVGRKQRVIGG